MRPFTLPRSVEAYTGEYFNLILKEELGKLSPESLPLLEGMAHGNHIGPAGIEVIVLSVRDYDDRISVDVGICYTSVVAGCSCADDPTPQVEQHEYCELQIEIDKNNALATVSFKK